MKVLIFADMHGSDAAFKKLETKAKSVGLLICLGDFTIFGQRQQKILKRLDDLGKLCLLIHGNHESAADVAADCQKLKLENVLFVHKKVLRVGHLIFIGYGGDGFSLRDKAFENIYAPRFVQGVKKYKEIIVKEGKAAKTILLFHGPPYGSKVDGIGDQHCGNKSFRDFYLKHKIDFVFSGHIHESAGAVEHIKNTTLMNPGPQGMIVDM
jgi:Icc-related predicted phosphoesterase